VKNEFKVMNVRVYYFRDAERRSVAHNSPNHGIATWLASTKTKVHII